MDCAEISAHSYVVTAHRPTAVSHALTCQLFGELPSLVIAKGTRLEVHVIFVTATDTGWAYAIQGATIAEDQEIGFDDADALLEADTEGLVAVINALP